MDDNYERGGLTGGKEPEPGQKHESCMKQAPCGSQRHSEAQSHGRLEIGRGLVRCALSRTRRRWCISAAKSRDHYMYHGSSSAACSGGNRHYAYDSICPLKQHMLRLSASLPKPMPLAHPLTQSSQPFQLGPSTHINNIQPPAL